MATVVDGSARSCGGLLAVILGLLCVMLHGATHRIAQDAVAIGHDTMQSPLLLLDRPMMETKKMDPSSLGTVFVTLPEDKRAMVRAAKGS